MSTVKHVRPFKKPEPTPSGSPVSNPFGRKDAGRNLGAIAVFSFMLACLVGGASFAYTSRIASAEPSSFAPMPLVVAETSRVVGAVNAGMFTSYAELGSSIVHTGELALHLPALALSSAAGGYASAIQSFVDGVYAVGALQIQGYQNMGAVLKGVQAAPPQKEPSIELTAEYIPGNQ